jgi:hypothetical protein
MVLVFVLVVSFSLVVTGAFIAIVEIRDPTVDTDQAVDVLFAAITVIIGALLGLLAGKADSSSLTERPRERDQK